MILEQIKKTFQLAITKNWDKTFWSIDLHETCLKPNYQVGNIPKEFYPYAKETLQILSNLPEVTLIMYTCSHPNEIEKYIEYFEENNIHFEYVNKNPEVPSQGYGYYQDKFYMNVGFDDKFGFDAHNDWKLILDYLNEHIVK
jgi:hypothetical protein